MRPLAIQTVGAFTGAGTNAARALGSLRLGLKFFAELPTLDADGDPIIGAPDAARSRARSTAWRAS